MVELTPAELRDYLLRAHGMATGRYVQSDTEMRNRIAHMLEKAVEVDDIMRGFLGRGGQRADCDALGETPSLHSELEEENRRMREALGKIAKGNTSGPPGLDESFQETCVRELAACRDVARAALSQ